MQKDSIILPIKAFIKQFPKLTRFLANYVDHFYEDYSVHKVFLEKNRSKTLKLNLGSGADSIDVVQCMQLSEHVENPRKMALEIHRALKPEGDVFLTVPFMYPYHEAPIDLNRWSQEGLKNLMKEFSPIQVGVLGGPTATFVEALPGWLSIALSFNSDKLYQVIYLLLLPFLKPFKIIDRILLNKYSSSHRLAAMFYFYGKKGPSSNTSR
ncbi:MAG: methyltransferase domain-containing protein [Nitrospinae bacterium]|nr:methyltransferase domain-containing protein [Nitrospinota bacterium]MBL7020631.1 methyltransferase domain-containing protein [Nitrospinaceae bacterium]